MITSIYLIVVLISGGVWFTLLGLIICIVIDCILAMSE